MPGPNEDTSPPDETTRDTTRDATAAPRDGRPTSADDTIASLLDARAERQVRALVGLGGNTGAVNETFDWAIAEISTHCGEIVNVSERFETTAIGPATATFLNAAIEITTDIDAGSLLRTLLELELSAGRRRAGRWGPRPLDLDLLTYDDAMSDDRDLTLPHPGCLYRRFVLDPLCEIAGDRLHPLCGVTFAELRARLLVRPLRVALAVDDPKLRDVVVWWQDERGVEVEFVEYEESSATAFLALWWASEAERADGAASPPTAVDLTRIPGSQGVAVQAVLDAAADVPRPV